MMVSVPKWGGLLERALRELYLHRNGAKGREMTEAELSALVALKRAFDLEEEPLDIMNRIKSKLDKRRKAIA